MFSLVFTHLVLHTPAFPSNCHIFHIDGQPISGRRMTFAALAMFKDWKVCWLSWCSNSHPLDWQPAPLPTELQRLGVIIRPCLCVHAEDPNINCCTEVSWILLRLINPFPYINAFGRLCSRRLFENMAQKKKLLKTSNFSFLPPCFQLDSIIVFFSIKGNFCAFADTFSKSSASDFLYVGKG